MLESSVPPTPPGPSFVRPVTSNKLPLITSQSPYCETNSSTASCEDKVTSPEGHWPYIQEQQKKNIRKTLHLITTKITIQELFFITKTLKIERFGS
jgi:hypothetical protein